MSEARTAQAMQTMQAVPALDPADRPGADGHRFGPDLACAECGIAWDAHQQEPSPCVKDSPQDAFMRRPMIDEA